MKKTIKLFGIIALVAVIGFSMATCGGDDNGGGGSGYLTFSDGLPPKKYAYVYVLPNNTDTTSTALSGAASNVDTGTYIAFGFQYETEGNSYRLYDRSHSNEPFYDIIPLWAGSGTYMVACLPSFFDDLLWIKNVSFKNGSASIKKSDLKEPTD